MRGGGAIVTIPMESVAVRTGAVPAMDVVLVLDESATKANIKASTSTGGAGGLDLETVLSLRASVRSGQQPQYSWADVHVFDGNDQLIRAQSLPLLHIGTVDDGEVFGFEGSVYRGTGASPGSVWLAPDARKMQYRLYAEVAGAVYTDGLLRQHDLPPDSALTNTMEPPSLRWRAK